MAELVVPLCATIHLAGSMIKLVCCTAAMILMSGRTIDFGAMGVFIFAMDGVGSACSVGGHGAIAMAVDRIVGKGDE